MKKILFIIGIIMVLLVVTFSISKNKDCIIPHVYITALSSSSNGYGYDPLDRDIKRQYPMAHALICSAEANRFIYTYDKEALKNAIQNASWLVENRDINNNKIVGYGLPVAWDAFGDGSKNFAHTEYTITTALTIQGLLDVVDAIDKSSINIESVYKSKRDLYFKTAQKAIDSFIINKFYTENPDGTLVFWYSSQPQDYYPVTNSHSMLIGVIQKISNYPSIDIEKNKRVSYQDLADKGMKYLLQTKIEKDDYCYWTYLNKPLPLNVKGVRENHGVHAAYVADGILMYKRYGGRLSKEIDEQKILNGLKLFIKGNRVLELFSQPEISSRSWDAGYFLYVISKYYSHEKGIKESIYQYVLSREEKNGFRFYEDKDSPTNYIRFNAHVLIGLSKYFWNYE